MEKELFTEEELCKWLTISRSTLWRLRKEGLPYIKVGNLTRYDKDDVLAWLKSQRKSSEVVA
jgi:excisionase family DNA binding protein